MEKDYGFHVMNGEIHGRPVRVRNGMMKRCIAVILSALLAVGTSIPAVAAEPVQTQTEETGTALSENAEAMEEDSENEVAAESESLEEKDINEEDPYSPIIEEIEEESDSEEMPVVDAVDEVGTSEETNTDEDSLDETSKKTGNEESADTEESENNSPEEVTEEGTEEQKETSGWLEDYSYELNNDSVCLTSYNGSETDVVVPGSAEIEGKTYPVSLSCHVWGAQITSLTFEDGVTFNSASGMFANMTSLESISFSPSTKIRTWDVSYMFQDCSKLKELDLSMIDNRYGESYQMLQGCVSLQKIITPVGVGSSVELPAAFKGQDGKIYYEIPSDLEQSITLTRVEASDWLSDYKYSISDDRIILEKYIGIIPEEDQRRYSVPGSADVDSVHYDKIELSRDIWSSMGGAVELSFGRGVVFPADSDRLFAYLEKLTTIDLSEVDVSGAVTMEQLFDGCNALSTIKTPINLSFDENLPGAFTDENDNVYTALPKNLNESVTLTKLELDNWLKDYTFYISGDKIVLTEYLGTGTEVFVPGYAEIGNSVYNKVELTPMLFTRTIDHRLFYSLSFGKGVVFPDNCEELFEEYSGEIIDLSNVDTSNVTNMGHMFWGCYCLEELDLTGFDISNVKDMSSMFYQCTVLKKLNISGLNTSKVENMEHMFGRCDSLTELDLSGWDLSSVRYAVTAFDGTIPTIKAPAGVTAVIGLGATYTGSDGNSYGTFPQGKDSPIVLTFESSDVPQSEIISIMRHPQDQKLREGETVEFELELLDWVENLNFEWQWSRDGVTWSKFGDYNSGIISFPMSEQYDGCAFRCKLTSGDETEYTDIAVLYLLDPEPAEILNQPANIEVRAGETAEFTVSAKGKDPKYQWQWSKDGVNWYDCTGESHDANTFSFTMQERFGGRHYRCIVTAGKEILTSDPATVSLVRVNKIISDPKDVEASVGDRVSFKVEATGSEINYQWQYSINGTYWSNCKSGNYNSDEFSFEMQEKYSGRQYRCKVNADGETMISNAALLTVLKKGEITAQPESVEVSMGDTAEFTVAFNGNNPEYQWQYSLDGKYWSNCKSGSFNTDTFSFVMQERFIGRSYRCVISSDGVTYISDGAAVNLPASDLIVSQPSDLTVNVGESAAFHVEAAGDDVHYQWQWSANGTTWKNCTGKSYNTDTFSFTAQKRFSGRRYRCIVKDGDETAYSESGRLIVNE